MAIPQYPNVASDVSDDGKVELYLFWQLASNVVDVSIYIQVPGGKRAELSRSYPVGHDEYYFEYRLLPGNILSPHTEYFEHQILNRPKLVEARYSGPASQAKAVAL